jgi:hypothetical protein
MAKNCEIPDNQVTFVSGTQALVTSRFCEETNSELMLANRPSDRTVRAFWIEDVASTEAILTSCDSPRILSIAVISMSIK